MMSTTPASIESIPVVSSTPTTCDSGATEPHYEKPSKLNESFEEVTNRRTKKLNDKQKQ